MQLSDLQVPIATRIHFTVAGTDKNPQTCTAQFIGYRCEHSLIAFMPKRPAFVLRQGMQTEVRLGLQSAIIRFTSSILAICEHPYLYLHLTYPSEVVIEKQLRKALRFHYDKPANCLVGESNATIVPCVFVDISLSGARLAFNARLPASVSRMTISFSAQIADAEHLIELEVDIKSLPEEASAAPFCYGVVFSGKSLQHKLLLEALCFELQEHRN